MTVRGICRSRLSNLISNLQPILVQQPQKAVSSHWVITFKFLTIHVPQFDATNARVVILAHTPNILKRKLIAGGF